MFQQNEKKHKSFIFTRIKYTTFLYLFWYILYWSIKCSYMNDCLLKKHVMFRLMLTPMMLGSGSGSVGSATLLLPKSGFGFVKKRIHGFDY